MTLDQIPMSFVLKGVGLLCRFSSLNISLQASIAMKITVKNVPIGKAAAKNVMYPY